MNTTVLSSCARVGLRPEVAIPRTPTLAGRMRSLHESDASMIIPTLYDPPDVAVLYHSDTAHAVALTATMSAPQRVRQAFAYAAWLSYHILEIDLATVLAAWEQP